MEEFVKFSEITADRFGQDVARDVRHLVSHLGGKKNAERIGLEFVVRDNAIRGISLMNLKGSCMTDMIERPASSILKGNDQLLGEIQAIRAELDVLAQVSPANARNSYTEDETRSILYNARCEGEERQADNLLKGGILLALGVACAGVLGAVVYNSHTTAQKAQRGRELVNDAVPGAVTVNGLTITLPPKLVSVNPEQAVDLGDVGQVAERMGVALTGDPEQTLFNLTVSSSEKDAVKYPVTVGKLQEVSEAINLLENGWVENLSRSGSARGRH